MNTTKCNCAEVHAFPAAVENFECDRGFSLYDLPLTYSDAKESERVYWDTITPETDFKAALRYFEALAVEYLEEGTVNHYCN